MYYPGIYQEVYYPPMVLRVCYSPMVLRVCYSPMVHAGYMPPMVHAGYMPPMVLRVCTTVVLRVCTTVVLREFLGFKLGLSLFHRENEPLLVPFYSLGCLRSIPSMYPNINSFTPFGQECGSMIGWVFGGLSTAQQPR